MGAYISSKSIIDEGPEIDIKNKEKMDRFIIRKGIVNCTILYCFLVVFGIKLVTNKNTKKKIKIKTDSKEMVVVVEIGTLRIFNKTKI